MDNSEQDKNSPNQSAIDMAMALEHLALCCQTYAKEHLADKDDGVLERARGASTMGTMALAKADALRQGRITPDFIMKTR